MGTVFVISEIPPTGREGDGGKQAQRFEWTSEKTAGGTTLVGARACPQEVMEIGGMMRMVATQNPGSIAPSFQMLGPGRAPIQLHGKFDDRYNGEGWAVTEMRRFEDMCRRGNMVRVSLNDEGFLGIVRDWSFDYRRSWDIGYKFTLEIHSRDDEAVVRQLPEPDAWEPTQILAKLDRQVFEIGKIQARRPTKSMYASVVNAVNVGVGTVIGGIDSVAKALDTKTGVLKPLGDLKNLATQLDSIRGHCSAVLTQLVIAKSTACMTYQTAKDVVDFEVWSKMLGAQMRLMHQHSRQGSTALAQRADGGTKGIYRPRKGQSLYSVSRDVYGTPHGWKGIYFANHLSSTTALGTETWIIPARAG